MATHTSFSSPKGEGFQPSPTETLKATQKDAAKRVARYAHLTGRLETQLNGLLPAASPQATAAGVQLQDASRIKEAIYEGLDEGVEDDEVNSTTV